MTALPLSQGFSPNFQGFKMPSQAYQNVLALRQKMQTLNRTMDYIELAPLGMKYRISKNRELLTFLFLSWVGLIPPTKWYTSPIGDKLK